MYISDLTILSNFNIVLEHLRKQGLARRDKEIIDKTGYSKSTVSNYLSGVKPLSLEFVKKVLEVYKVDLNEVFKKDGSDKGDHQIKPTIDDLLSRIEGIDVDLRLLKEMVLSLVKQKQS